MRLSQGWMATGTAGVRILLPILPALCGAVLIASTPAWAGGAEKGGKAMAFTVTSPAFGEGKEIPRKYTGEGEDISPPLQWSGVPTGTKELALICDDPDAPTPEPWVHWVMYRIPTTAAALVEGITRTERPDSPAGAIQGKNTGGRVGYNGPLPPPGHGWHRYIFALYALDAPLDITPGATKKDLLDAMRGHILGETRLTGKYKR